jgi:hypothetical protein
VGLAKYGRVGWFKKKKGSGWVGGKKWQAYDKIQDRRDRWRGDMGMGRGAKTVR